MVRTWRSALPGIALLLSTAAWAVPTLRNPGLHAVATDGSAARWLGPGMDPAWLPDGKALLAHSAHGLLGDPAFGPAYFLDPATRAARVVAGGLDLAGLKPAPSARYVAALRLANGRRSAELVVFDAVSGALAGAPLAMGEARPGLRDQYAWRAETDTLVWQAENGVISQRRLPDGAVELTTAEADRALLGALKATTPAGMVGEMVVVAGRGYALTQVGEDTRLVRFDPATGESTALAEIDPRVPLLDRTWPARPALSPDGREVVVSLGRSDRMGVASRDLIEADDTDVSGQTVRVSRRVRNVGPSGVVFDSAKCAFAGQAAPKIDSAVVGDRRPGTMRWQRPTPARWVVLHHTASNSDSGNLNALTSGTTWRLAGFYQDITPGERLPREPRTIGVQYLVFRSGVVCQLAEESTIARHAGTGQWTNKGPIYDFNAETIGIEIVSRGDDYTPGQVQNVGRLVADICARRGIPPRHIEGESFTEGVLYHRDFAGGLRGKPDPSGWPWEQSMAEGRRWLASRR
ncbi:MAG: N-acetylmuramoyl-L-alanine amidase [Armatimonadetes bacterium]|nr:N-acetylmuramoyl-L-alanine amidase [Armatimonadota bacterium]